MARTKQTAYRRQESVRAGPSNPPVFRDHAGDSYSVLDGAIHDLNADLVIRKLGIQLYSLSKHGSEPKEIAWGLQGSRMSGAIAEAVNRSWRLDVYTSPKGSIEECVEHYRREMSFRQSAVKALHEAAADAVQVNDSDDEEDVQQARQEAVHALRGKEPLPHMVPCWGKSIRTLHFYREWDVQLYRNFLLVLPEECTNYNDLEAGGIWVVKFDQVWSPALETETWDYDPDEDQVIDERLGWVEVFKTGRTPDPDPSIARACIKSLPHAQNVLTPGCTVALSDVLYKMLRGFGDCCYRTSVCEDCHLGLENHACENELHVSPLS